MSAKRRSEPAAEGPPAPPARPRRWLAPLLVLLAILGSGSMFFRVISEHAVNILYYDQWDYYKPLFDGQSVWSMFPVQHGPVRQGLGGVLIGMVARSSAWNTRADSFAVGITIALALAVAFAVKRRLGNRLTAADALLPLLFFNLAQVESLVVVPNPAHGAMPLLLAMLYVLAWTLENRRVAYAAILICNVFLIFTGFAFFVGVITPLLLLLEGWRHWREERRVAWEPLAAVAVALISLAIFFRGWVFEPSIDCFKFPHSRPLEYLWFIALMFARFLGVVYATEFGVVLGMILFAFLVWIVVRHAIALVRNPVRDNRSLAIVVLGSWTLLFCANAAVGRVCSGLGGAQMSRYATLLIPGFFAMYLHLTTLAEEARTRLMTAFATILLTLPLMNLKVETDLARRYATGKRQWRDCYLSARDVTACDTATRFSVYPTPTIDEKLAFLERNRLNLFSRP